MSWPVLNKVLHYFSGNFQCSEFAYLAYPFLKIYKMFGFLPVKLSKSMILDNRMPRFEWDPIAWCWTLVGMFVYVGGFWYGVNDLHISEIWDKKHDASVIAYLTSWIQVIMLFVLGALAVISSWLNIGKLKCLCWELNEIDHRLEILQNRPVDYRNLRKQFMWQFGLALLVPVSLSMVNCVIIQPEPKFRMLSGCYWFICFAPILMLTFNELQFFSWLSVLQMKFAALNEKLSSYTTYAARNCGQPFKVVKVQSIQELPLSDSDGAELNLSTLQQIVETYSLIADCVDVVMKMFSWHLLFTITASFGVITIQSYNLFALLVHSLHLRYYQVAFVVCWILVQMFSIAVKIHGCSKTSKTMSITGPLLLKVNMQSPVEPTCLYYQVVQLFLFEIQRRKHCFTAAGFFDMDYKLITSIITAVTTYLVIIIQFHLTTEGHAH